MLEFWSLARSLAFAIIYGGIEYRYINRNEAGWTKEVEGFYEKPAFWKISPYQTYLLLPLFIAVGFTLPVSAWAANTFLIAVLEDAAYFGFRGRWVMPGEWTTTLFSSVTVRGVVIPLWWPLDLLIVGAFYAVPF
ncbi:MAG: hypothetical protein HY296_05850 [Thaumarchaeota archaeon]|nr:hypothetical protein [Nitrososphaerota archaeon]